MRIRVNHGTPRAGPVLQALVTTTRDPITCRQEMAEGHRHVTIRPQEEQEALRPWFFTGAILCQATLTMSGDTCGGHDWGCRCSRHRGGGAAQHHTERRAVPGAKNGPAQREPAPQAPCEMTSRTQCADGRKGLEKPLRGNKTQDTNM